MENSSDTYFFAVTEAKEETCEGSGNQGNLANTQMNRLGDQIIPTFVEGHNIHNEDQGILYVHMIN